MFISIEEIELCKLKLDNMEEMRKNIIVWQWHLVNSFALQNKFNWISEKFNYIFVLQWDKVAVVIV